MTILRQGLIMAVLAAVLAPAAAGVYEGDDPPGKAIDEWQRRLDEHTFYVRGPGKRWYKLSLREDLDQDDEREEWDEFWDEVDKTDWDWKRCVAEPDLEVKIEDGDWATEVSAESNPLGNLLYLKLTNTGRWPAMFRFQGPESNADWDLTYSREFTTIEWDEVSEEATRLVPVTRHRRVWEDEDWEEVPYTEFVEETYTYYVWRPLFKKKTEETSNEFNVLLFGGESQIVTVMAEEKGAPANYLLAEFSLTRKQGGPPWDLPTGPPPFDDDDDHGKGPPVGLPPGPPPGIGQKQTATARANLVVPGDAMLQLGSQTVWIGEDVLAVDPDPWQLTQEGAVTVSSKQSATYLLRIQNVWNASVSYSLREYRPENDACIARYYVEGLEITGQIRSPGGYRTATLNPGEHFLLAVKITPVGTSRVPHKVALTSQVAEIAEPVLDMASFARFDGVLAATGLLTVTKVRTTDWREEH